MGIQALVWMVGIMMNWQWRLLLLLQLQEDQSHQDSKKKDCVKVQHKTCIQPHLQTQGEEKKFLIELPLPPNYAYSYSSIFQQIIE